MKNYNPAAWYWLVAGDTTRVFSSFLGSYVPASDASFVEWSADGTVPSVIDTEASLGAVLAGDLSRPSTAAVLDAYQLTQADKVMSHTAFKVLFNHENRLRALEGKVPVTASQARSAVKALM
jgi:hypothetical protein